MGRGGPELDTRLYAWYYGKSYIIALPQARPIAIPNQLILETANLPITLPTRLINDQNFLRLDALAQALESSFDIVYFEGSHAMVTGRPYTGSVTGYHSDNWIVAQIWSEEIFVDGATHPALSYDIAGFIYYRLRDILQILGYEIVWQNGVTRIVS